MRKHSYIHMASAGAAAGAVTGLFGAGGGMVLIPLLTALTDLKENELFASSITVIAPICLISLLFSGDVTHLSWQEMLPWLIGSTLGGLIAGYWGRRVPLLWLHRGLGILILWGGLRYLWS